jgi:cytochrome c-type biogenesis protein CcmH
MGVRIRDSGFGGVLRLLLVVAVVLGIPGPVLGQEGAREQVTRSEDTAERAIGQIRSPYCPGLMLEVCPSPEAGALRDSIRDLAREGKSERELVEWMIAGHGEEWRAVPKRSGRGIFAWVIPPLFLLVGAGVVAARLRRDQRAAGEAAPVYPETDLSEDDRARLAAAMQQMEDDEEEDG